MFNKKNTDILKSKYLDTDVHKILMKSSTSISFFFDIKSIDANLYMLTSNLSLFGLPEQDVYTLSYLLSKIETDNALAEVEGKHHFIKHTLQKIKSMEKDIYLYIPFKREKQPIWLYIHFSNVTKDQQTHLIYGQVLRIFETTPDEILYYQKTYQDPMTKLFTRETLKLHLDYLTNLDNSYGLYVDIDGFKRINDRFGHLSGDQFIKDIAAHFISMWESNVIYYRLGGDEFFVYVYNHSKDEVIARAEKIISDISNLTEHARICKVSASIGIVPINQTTKSYYTLLDVGDQTMYASKHKGSGIITLLSNI